MKYIVLLAALLCTLGVRAEEKPWVFEFELATSSPSRLDRLLNPSCSKVVPVELVEWYSVDPRPGWERSCGNDQPMYLHFLGRRCWKPLPNFIVECGWRHFSSPGDSNEVAFDALSVRGKFRFGRP
jgi:hypothetical protein